MEKYPRQVLKSDAVRQRLRPRLECVCVYLYVSLCAFTCICAIRLKTRKQARMRLYPSRAHDIRQGYGQGGGCIRCLSIVTFLKKHPNVSAVLINTMQVCIAMPHLSRSTSIFPVNRSNMFLCPEWPHSGEILKETLPIRDNFYKQISLALVISTAKICGVMVIGERCFLKEKVLMVKQFWDEMDHIIYLHWKLRSMY